jgi:hypothetical protein
VTYKRQNTDIVAVHDTRGTTRFSDIRNTIAEDIFAPKGSTPAAPAAVEPDTVPASNPEVEGVADDPAGTDDGLEGLTVPQLKALAKEEGIEGVPVGIKKADLIALIRGTG